jgi:hypothetical protein
MENNRPNSNSGAVCVQTLSHADIMAFLLAFAEAVALDLERVESLPTESFHPLYDPKKWRYHRQDCLYVLFGLRATTKGIAYRLLKALTAVSIGQESPLVRREFVKLLRHNARTNASGYNDSAPELFEELIKRVGIACSAPVKAGDARARMMSWIAPIDPLGIAEDPECGYLAGLRRFVETETGSG